MQKQHSHKRKRNRKKVLVKDSRRCRLGMRRETSVINGWNRSNVKVAKGRTGSPFENAPDANMSVQSFQ
jgi:hypothetical protein